MVRTRADGCSAVRKGNFFFYFCSIIVEKINFHAAIFSNFFLLGIFNFSHVLLILTLSSLRYFS